MDERLHNDEQLIRYLDGEMKNDERTNFEKRLKVHQKLAAQLESLQIAVKAAQQYGIREQVQSVHKTMMQELSGRKEVPKVAPLGKTVRYTMAVAASVILIFIVALGYYFFQLSPDKVYSEAFVEYNVSAVRGTEYARTKIESYYKEKSFAAVINEASAKPLA